MTHTFTLDVLFTAHGYYSVEKAGERRYIDLQGNGDTAYSYHVHDNGLVEFELLTICLQPRREVCDISTPEGMTILIQELIGHKTKEAADAASEEAMVEGIRQAQNTFEQGYWEHMDGKNSDFDPTFYGTDGYLIDR